MVLPGSRVRVSGRGCGTLSAVVPAGDDALELLLVPGLVGHLAFQVRLEAEVAEALRLADPLVVIRDGLPFRRQGA